ncbi:carbamoyltransferase HypF [bacterium]|nr:MAG: carbamoyltransferase HypF [bacterium]
MRLKISITGTVQGVGFRPFIFRLAKDMGLTGYVLNDTTGVLIEVEGKKDKLDEFLIRLEEEKPSLARIYSLQYSFLQKTGFKDFEIRQSQQLGKKRVSILPDIAVCNECLHDINNPGDRRFLYPFTNCTNCGPRYTIINNLPYDRKNTSMKSFTMCKECENEYSLPVDRRFHAQPDACPLCGPWVRLYDSEGTLLSEKEEAITNTVNLIRSGSIIAVKGIGGYHLLCDATNRETVDWLRQKKGREEKPMAVMFPDIEGLKKEVHTSLLEERAITSIERPIVIVRKKQPTALAESVSPDNQSVGVFLPYTPLHQILLQRLKQPLIATSANLSEEPIVKDDEDAFQRLSGIADYILTHNREIVRRCDDSVVRISADRQVPIRRSRGFAPLPVSLPFTLKRPVLALGPYMNSTIALGVRDKVFLSQHIGDLDTPLAMAYYEETVYDLLRLLDVKPEVVVSDMHPGYYSTRFGEKHYKKNLMKVQHHYAHILSCMADNNMPEDAEVIGFAFDGTGYGVDSTIWGSEVFIASYRNYQRVFHLLPYRLPGGDKAVKEPVRTAFSLLYETFRGDVPGFDFLLLPEKERLFFTTMIEKNINSPVTTSMGRLFDGVSSMINVKHTVSYHAQAAIALEQIALKSDDTTCYPFTLDNGTIDFRPMIKQVSGDVKSSVPKEIVAKKFHNTVVDIISSIAEQLREGTGLSSVALTGGVFQNTILLEQVFSRLKQRGFSVLIHQLVPPNDGGISLGQVAAAHHYL